MPCTGRLAVYTRLRFRVENTNGVRIETRRISFVTRPASRFDDNPYVRTYEDYLRARREKDDGFTPEIEARELSHDERGFRCTLGPLGLPPTVPCKSIISLFEARVD